VPDLEAARALGEIKRQVHIPLAADIHFDHRLALEALRQGVDKLRLNPGNLRDREKVATIAREAKARGVPIRVGVNAGSLPAELRERVRAGEGEKRSEATAQALVEAARQHLRILEDLDFREIVVSLKAFDVPATRRAYQLMAEETDYPLHVGLTEAGLPPAGLVRSAVGIGLLLAEGIGDTIRVSLTASPLEEVAAGREILKALEIRRAGVTLISCPECGRAEVDLRLLAGRAQLALAGLDRKLIRQQRELRVAVMGCVVNGPGEAREAEVGVACGKGKGVLFRKGEVVGTLPEEKLLEALLAEAERVVAGFGLPARGAK
jgi:(E)-4-hydroxy-3-methylbut-2-enyl-diphosphate synthase